MSAWTGTCVVQGGGRRAFVSPSPLLLNNLPHPWFCLQPYVYQFYASVQHSGLEWLTLKFKPGEGTNG